MYAALQTLMEVAPASAQVSMRLKLAVFVRGSLGRQDLDPDTLWELLREQPFAAHVGCDRSLLSTARHASPDLGPSLQYRRNGRRLACHA